MPELPEVETIVRGLRQGSNDVPPLPGYHIRSVDVGWPRHIAEPSPKKLKRRIQGQRIEGIRRRGKYLVFPLERDTLLIHLKMSGDLSMAPASTERGPYDHTVFELDDGWELRFSDARKFGKVFLVDDPQSILANLGPEPLDPSFSPTVLTQRLQGRSRAIKPLLLEQSFIAGVGNIYADEALHRAGIHPLTPADQLDEERIEALYHGIQEALRQGIQRNGASIDWVYRGGDYQNHFRVYGRESEPCPVCQTPIRKIVVSQRGTHFCPRCQPRGDSK
ncbi:MAG: DNA-formamidopyrimidine glycosylase [Anaerolineales bacterium]